MKKLFSVLLLVALVFSLVACSSGGTTPTSSAAAGGDSSSAEGSSSAAASGEELNFALIVMAAGSDYFTIVDAGAQKAAEEISAKGTKVSVQYLGPAPDDNARVEGQVAQMENVINAENDAILVTPLDGDSLGPPTDKAYEAGIPVICVDGPVDSENYVTTIATDNVQGGYDAMKALIEIIGGEGNVVLVNGLPGSPSNDDRNVGARQAVEETDGKVVMLEEIFYATQAEHVTAVENLLASSADDIDGIFGAYNQGALGAWTAVGNKGLFDSISIVGYDADADEIAALEKGEIKALIVQQPFTQGYDAVYAAFEYITENKEFEKFQPAPHALITTENMEEPEMEAILYPMGKE